jgi:hypothetical protein
MQLTPVVVANLLNQEIVHLTVYLAAKKIWNLGKNRYGNFSKFHSITYKFTTFS